MERTAVSYKTYTCPVQRACGGCQWLNVPYPIQLRRKQDELDELLGAFCEVDPILGMDNPLHYRNKVISPWRRARAARYATACSRRTRIA